MTDDKGDKKGGEPAGEPAGSIPDEVVKGIEDQIGKLEKEDRDKLIGSLSDSHKKELEATKKAGKEKEAEYQTELKKLQDKFNVQGKEHETNLEAINKKIDDMNKTFGDTWGQFKPDRSGMSNTKDNPFKDKTPTDIIKEIKDPRKWNENPALKKQMEDEFKQIIGL